MSENLRRRLRELGVVKGVRELATLPPRRRVAIEHLASGYFHTTSHGQCFVAEATYPPDHLHGDLPLSAFLDLPAEIVAQVARDGALAGVNLQRACFLDTETTGLSGGAGTMAFMVGLGYFDETGFRLRQYFLRDPGDEPPMVEALAEILPQFEALVSFNGRGFDVPILENRFILARIPPPTTGMSHLDLLPPARRLWRYSLPSCALTALERDVLGVMREQDDVPGGLIPYLYRDYLRTGDARGPGSRQTAPSSTAWAAGTRPRPDLPRRNGPIVRPSEPTTLLTCAARRCATWDISSNGPPAATKRLPAGNNWRWKQRTT
jgi:uncharacterized protein YprB with RNaseH-like and TPR domain